MEQSLRDTAITDYVKSSWRGNPQNLAGIRHGASRCKEKGNEVCTGKNSGLQWAVSQSPRLAAFHSQQFSTTKLANPPSYKRKEVQIVLVIALGEGQPSPQ